ncbi:hypothetical protein BC332_13358 [Capsicum chinense]|nr:hypothetical protein BC332_13358 [Capsicum chinense]
MLKHFSDPELEQRLKKGEKGNSYGYRCFKVHRFTIEVGLAEEAAYPFIVERGEWKYTPDMPSAIMAHRTEVLGPNQWDNAMAPHCNVKPFDMILILIVERYKFGVVMLVDYDRSGMVRKRNLRFESLKEELALVVIHEDTVLQVREIERAFRRYKIRPDLIPRKIVKIARQVYVDINTVTNKEIQEHIRRQPLTYSIDSDTSLTDFVGQGVYIEPTEEEIAAIEELIASGEKATTHAMLIMGYGRDEKSGEDYFLVQNSWGRKWGYSGYRKIKCSLVRNLRYPFANEEEEMEE